MIERERNEVLSPDEAERESGNIPDVRRGPAGTAMQPERRENREGTNANEDRLELLPANETQELQSRWDRIQAGFVDEPRQSVQQADALVDETIRRLSDTFSQARTKMEQDWGRGDDVSTENLRMALRRYRSFFTRLLKM